MVDDHLASWSSSFQWKTHVVNHEAEFLCTSERIGSLDCDSDAVGMAEVRIGEVGDG
jgi:hypothetical protein